jgi:uncharacterized protein (DUF305 family)
MLLEVHMAPSWSSLIPKPAIWLATILSVAATSVASAQDPANAQQGRAEIAAANEQQFMFDNDLAMSNMSRDMLVKPTGDIDRDFVALMIPHHQGAVDMARAELKYGHNQELRRLAQNIVIQRQQEISAMRAAVGEAAPTQGGSTPASAESAISR